MKLGYMMLMVAVGAMLVIAPSVIAADRPAKAHGDKNVVYGEVKKVDGDTIIIAAKGQKGAAAEEKTVNIKDAKVVIASKGADGKVEEKEGAKTDVKEGARVAVTTSEDGKTATKVAIMPAREKKAK